jgi:molybdenum cofactor biosynthesis enzyme MoaA
MPGKTSAIVLPQPRLMISGADFRPNASQVLDALQRELEKHSLTIAELIRIRSLYFRVSVVGNCNFRCPFCHNEGGPAKGKLTLDQIEIASRAASDVGFRRVQFTGGEPLIHPELAKFISTACSYFQDVGVTTNGSLLTRRLDGLARAGLHRLHISLQRESLIAHEADAVWRLPTWLQSVVDFCSDRGIALKLNLPVAAPDLGAAERFLHDTRVMPFGLSIFSILPESDEPAEVRQAYLTRLVEIVRAEDESRGALSADRIGKVSLRSYRKPTGMRCVSCSSVANCTEQSRSLRLGVDYMLRPCLATRDWDMPLRPDHARSDMYDAALLALDYEPLVATI